MFVLLKNSFNQLCMGKIFKILLFLFFIITSANSVMAQDTIVLKTGEKLIVTVVDISEQFIEYKIKTDDKELISAIHKSEVSELRYSDGRIDIIVFENIELKYTEKDISFYQELAKSDARKSYSDYKKASVISASTTLLLTPVIGFIPTYLSYKKEPNEHQFNYPDSTLLDNEIYQESYKQEASKIKKEKIRVSYGASTFSWLLVATLIYNLQPFKN